MISVHFSSHGLILYNEDGGSRFLQNVGSYVYLPKLHGITYQKKKIFFVVTTKRTCLLEAKICYMLQRVLMT